jgi:hypothetical protein
MEGQTNLAFANLIILVKCVSGFIAYSPHPFWATFKNPYSLRKKWAIVFRDFYR